MNSKVLIILVVVFCSYFAYRHYAAASAAKALAQIPVNPGGTGGMDSLQPTRELSNYRQPNRHTGDRQGHPLPDHQRENAAMGSAQRDANPERELLWWERVAGCYVALIAARAFSPAGRRVRRYTSR